MPEFVRLTKFGKGRGSHDHIAYLRDDGTGFVTENKGHVHEMYLQQPQPLMDEMTGMPMMDALSGQPMMAGVSEPTWVVEEANGHVHEIAGEVERTEQQPKKTTEEKITMVRDLYKAAAELEGEFRKEAQESDDFYQGKQWKDAHKQELEASDRAAHTINLLEPGIDILSGYQRQNRSDIRYYPVENGDGRVADILTEVVKNITEQNDFEYAETEMFEDMAIAGRGFLNCYIDYDENIEGDIKVEHYKWSDVYMGPHEYKDARDCEYGLKAKWYSREKLEQWWPDKATDLVASFELMQQMGESHEDRGVDAYEEPNVEEGKALYIPEPEFVDIAKKQFRLIECERVVYRRVPVLANDMDDFYFNAEGWGKDDVSAVKSIPGFVVVYRKVNDLHRLKVAGTVLLEDEILEDETFSFIPGYAKKRGCRCWGKIHPAKDSQKEVNKRHSQATDILNKMSGRGWFYDSDTFDGKQQELEFAKVSSSAGFKARVRDLKKIPQLVDGVRVPAEIITMEENAVSKLQQILNISPDLVSKAPNDASGIALVERKKQALTGNENLFDNLNLVKKILGKKLVGMIQKVYTPERMIRIIENRIQRNPVQIGGQEQGPEEFKFQRDEYLRVLEEADLTKFDVVVGASPNSPTTMMGNFVLMSEMSQRMPIPPQALVELAPMPDEQKRKILAMIAQQAQAQQQQQQMESQTEIQKTVIANQARQQGGPPR